MSSGNCHDCGALVGQEHEAGCDVERCRLCGRQMISCDCAGIDGDTDDDGIDRLWAEYMKKVEEAGGRLRWTGESPGKAEARELGFYCYWKDGEGWVLCEKDHPEAMEDLNRLLGSGEAVWNKEKGRWVKQAPPSERSETNTETS